MQTRTADDGAFVMEWYAPAAVTALNDGEYQTTGKPYKTSSYSVTKENGVKTVTMTRQQGDLPPYTITRIEQGNLVTIRVQAMKRLFAPLKPISCMAI